MNLLGIELDDVPDDVTVTEAVLLVKGMDDQGVLSIWKRSSDGLTAWEELGMLRGAVLVSERDLLDAWESDDDA